MRDIFVVETPGSDVAIFLECSGLGTCTKSGWVSATEIFEFARTTVPQFLSAYNRTDNPILMTPVMCNGLGYDPQICLRGLAGDRNEDYKVDILDLTITARTFGSR